MSLFAADIDECSADGVAGCDQTCMNTDGGYRCDCGTLYTLNANGRTCDNINGFSALMGGVAGLIILIIAVLALAFALYLWQSKQKAPRNPAIEDNPPNPL